MIVIIIILNIQRRKGTYESIAMTCPKHQFVLEFLKSGVISTLVAIEMTVGCNE